MLWPFNKYPGTDYETFNWDWLLNTVKQYTSKIDSFFKTDVYRYLENVLAAHPEWMQPVNDVQVWARPEAYGAYGDGIADDTTAVQDAMDTGLPVLLTGTYRITQTLVYNGPVIDGQGTIIADAGLIHTLETPGDKIAIRNITIDNNTKAAIGIYAHNAGGQFEASNVTVQNGENVLVGSYSVSGIYTTGHETAKVENCVIRNMVRSNSNPYVIGSTGVSLKATTMKVCNNYIDNITSTTADKTDSDGIFVASDTGVDTNAEVINNTIINSTGRFVKSQAKHTRIVNNKCSLTTGSDLFFKCFDLQLGGGTIEGNECALGNAISSASHLIQHHGDGTVNNIAINNNKFTNVPAGVSAFFYMDGDMANTFADIRNNYCDSQYITYCLRIPSTTGEGSITYDNNRIAFYRGIKLDGGVNADNIKFTITNNRSSYGGALISQEANNLIINNAWIENNRGFTDSLQHVDMTLTTGVTGGHVRALLESGSNLINPITPLQDSATHCFIEHTAEDLYTWYNYAHGTTGVYKV